MTVADPGGGVRVGERILHRGLANNLFHFKVVLYPKNQIFC